MTQRAVVIGDVSALLVRDGRRLRMFANTCRHRGHELLPEGGSSQRHSIVCPYHAWTYDLGGALIGARGFRDDESFEPTSTLSSSCPCRSGRAGSSATRCTRWVTSGAVVRRAPRRPGRHPRAVRLRRAGARGPAHLRGGGELEGDRRELPRVLPLPADPPELCQVTLARLGRQLRPAGAWIGGSMDLRDGMETMSMTGELAATPLPGVDPTRVEYLHLLPNLLVSAHPDYVMAHRLVPLAPGRTWVECSWLVAPGAKVRGGGARGSRLLGRDQQAGLGGLRVGAARARQPALQPGPFAPERTRSSTSSPRSVAPTKADSFEP